MELDASWGRIFVVWWALFWRSALVLIVAAIVGGVLSFAVTLILRFMNASIPLTVTLNTCTALLVGLVMSVLPIKMVVGKNLGDFRLALLKQAPRKNQRSQP